MTQNYLTIGQLAKRVALPPSTLRYYEREGVLPEVERSEAGYRLYSPAVAETLRFIQRAQRLGFTLAEIRLFLTQLDQGNLSQDELVKTAENRFLQLERQLTELMVVRHELGLFLQDLHQQVTADSGKTAVSLFTDLVDRVCHAPHLTAPDSMLDLLLQNIGCPLTSSEGQQLLQPLQNQHVHVWQEGDAYKILVVSHETAVSTALQSLANLEANCTVHEHQNEIPDLQHTNEGYLLTCRGDSAYIFARLFLSIAA